MAKSASGAGSIRKKTVTRSGKEYTYWEARYTTGYDPGTGRQIQRSITAKTQKEVRQKMAAAVASIDAGTYRETEKITLGQWLDVWERNYLVKQKPLTIKTYTAAIRNHIRPRLGSVRLDRLTTDQIQIFLRDLYDSLSPKTVKNIHGVLHKSLQQAVISGKLAQNPASGCEITTPEKPDIRPMEPSELASFLSASASDPYANLFIIAVATGMRQGELLGLSWDQVDFDSGTITISQQLLRVNQTYTLGTPKNGLTRTISPASLVFDAIRAERARQEAWTAALPGIWQNEYNLVFTTETGSNLCHRTVDKHFKRILAAAGLPDMRFHDLRHTYAVNSIIAGDDLKTLQSNLGHATSAFTLDVYGHYTKQMRSDSGSRMQAFLSGLPIREK